MTAWARVQTFEPDPDNEVESVAQLRAVLDYLLADMSRSVEQIEWKTFEIAVGHDPLFPQRMLGVRVRVHGEPKR